MTENILAAIAEKTKERIKEERSRMPLFEIRSNAEAVTAFGTGRKNRPTFREALAAPGMSFICEVKKASPSKGVIAEEFPYLEIAEEYEAAGASAVSCLTEPYYFHGSDQHLKQIASSVSIPVLRKDFTVDEYMIYQARVAGASAILLICSILG